MSKFATASCVGCGDDLSNRQETYCGSVCYGATSRVPRITRVCNQCGDTYDLTEYRASRRTTPFCSRKCQEASRIGYTYVTPQGYVVQRTSSGVGRDGAQLQHRLIMAEHLGRGLLPTETVHHKNGVRHDNRIENLELWTGSHGAGVRYADLNCHCEDRTELIW